MTGIRLYWPLWLIRLYRRLGAGRFEWTATLVAVVAGVLASGALDPLSGVLDGWLRLFGFALGLCLIWFAAVGTAPKPWLPASYIIALCMLVLWAVLTDQDRALAQRGEWTSATVISREDTPKSSSCTLRFQDGTEGPGPLGGCRNAEAGDRIRVFHDPEHSMRPSNTAPNLPLWRGLSAGSTLIMAATTYVAAKRGQQRYVPPAHPPARTAPPPPPPPPPPPGHSPGLR